MKKVLKYSLIAVIVVGVVFATSFFISTNNQDPIQYKSEIPTITTIEKKTVATGKVVPEDEVEIKPQISGIVEKVLVKEGELVETGDDWVEHVGFEVDKEIYAEVRIGLVNEADDVLDDVFARMLISRDPDHKFCHMLWKRD